MPKTKRVIVVFSFCLILSHVWCFGIHIKMDKQKDAGTSLNPLCYKTQDTSTLKKLKTQETSRLKKLRAP